MKISVILMVLGSVILIIAMGLTAIEDKEDTTKKVPCYDSHNNKMVRGFKKKKDSEAK